MFKDVAAHDAYQVDPIHLTFLKPARNTGRKVQVYDFE